ncbi:chorismate mutase [Helicobacter pylori]|uniref:chorismate mutase n=1 Tax=Helicobacter pylori TaxID=210 RepID=UPI0009A28503|nr:chorismate mutase [Helicobacter pylori]MBH0253103.1 chorismate mutase [Helicobacter pylori]MBH0260143.1 chorismate mutase [Helicobacter pylori]MBH0261262.1 chorismate mutase [Helicobacter pylori]MBH0288346.1 chorismate mutase [Helicobacter pylori]NHA94563.1 chorismate mutase [Helicobacter pylori]
MQKNLDSLLENLRAEIDVLDNELSDLLDKRLGIALKIALAKQESPQESPIYCPKREQEILKRLSQRDFKHLNGEILASFYAEIFKISRNFQENALKELKK